MSFRRKNKNGDLKTKTKSFPAFNELSSPLFIFVKGSEFLTRKEDASLSWVQPWRQDTQHNNVQRDDTQHNVIQHNDIKHNFI